VNVSGQGLDIDHAQCSIVIVGSAFCSWRIKKLGGEVNASRQGRLEFLRLLVVGCWLLRAIGNDPV